MGVLYSAPDTTEDSYIILSNVHLLPEPVSGDAAQEIRPIELKLIRRILIKVSDVKEMQVLTDDILEMIQSNVRKKGWLEKFWELVGKMGASLKRRSD